MTQNLNEKTRATRRKHILEAAAQVFAEKGFHATTIRDVAQRAGIGDGTLYYHFENKAALLLGLFSQLTETARQDLDPTQLMSLDLRDFIRMYLHHALSAVQDHNIDLFQAVFSEVMVSAPLRERFKQEVLQPMIEGAELFAQQWATKRGLKLQHDTLNMRILSSLILGLLIQRVMEDPVLTSVWNDLPDVVTDLLLPGFLVSDLNPPMP
ncbi:TetR/AcrR family transcriptional regulator [Deinococcus cellulosilyticus]|uniref:HTH tetR-type domain-containing protein n=1 Tax=Deinococcus cellulosilyticus (strain DSM 18568 / NBRC 106333 / KACC 11606 / 5516J-15) TaxID=1223518 RepID=A0A511MYQ4_DEIC1|nr:TetR/AcrR family transcriptional regulator [Deinococcus cellulosilyticus]GEM45481.1 hypothetical protein DC3_11160 [Deinococcus cellulosilyticus NBRC 106333 = KACC 11606]